MTAEPPGTRTARPTALVIGFGPFGSIVDNPAARLARASSGTTARWVVVGHTMPVSYRRSVEETARLVAVLRPALVLGVGVAVSRPQPCLEQWGRRWFDTERPDVDGVFPAWPTTGRVEARESRLPVQMMADAAGIQVSGDCGRYVCNGWLYACLGAFPIGLAVGFLHVPADGWTVPGLHTLLDACRPNKDSRDG